MPVWLVNRWSRCVAQHKEKSGEFPAFRSFVEFVSKEAKIACDPVTSTLSLKDLSLSDGKKGFTPFPKQDTKKPQGGRSFWQKLPKVQIQNLLAQDVPYVKEIMSLIPVMPFWKNLSQKERYS